jgi:hypothetical protein
MSEKQDYFNYVIDVLGVREILLEGHPAESLEQIPLLILVQDYATYSEEEKELLVKMIGAMKIEAQKIAVTDLSQRTVESSQYALYLCDEVGDENCPANEIQTYSPRILLQRPELKKPAWSALQKMMALIKH